MAGWEARRRVLRGPLRGLVIGQCVGQAADGLAQIAFAQFVVFDAGRGATPARLAAVLAVTLLPFSLIGPFTGVLIDRWSRRRVLIVMSFVRAALTLAALATVITHSQAGAFVGVLLLLSTSRFVLAAKGAALPGTVESDDLVTANAVSAIAGMSASFLGAIAGAAFVGHSAAAGFLAASVLYVGAGFVFVRLPELGGQALKGLGSGLRVALAEARDGLRTIARTPDIRRPLGAVWLHRLLLGAGFVLVVLAADSRFHLKIAGYGLALGATGIAAFLGSLAAPVCAQRWRPAALIPFTFVPPALAVLAGALFTNLVVMIGALGLTGFSFQLLKVLADAMVGRASADGVRGRVFSIYDVLYNVAFVLAGLLMIPLWRPDRLHVLLAALAAAFLAGGLAFRSVFRNATRTDPDRLTPAAEAF
ncbi:MAG TPA: MFS transporter [Frankiaceae bacterium]|nr:MFS transporter [Frankiaceae bacterium]